MAGLSALKIEISAATASFRYPRIQVGRLPTFEMPPPATLYGLLAGVRGEWFEPGDLEFAYTFEHSGKSTDLETIQPIERGSGKPSLKARGWPHPVNVQCNTNIQGREFLLRPKMKLYLRSKDAGLLAGFSRAFMNPCFALVLGRSQDLATCDSAAMVELDESGEGFFSHTLLPIDWRPWVSPGTTVVLPAALDYQQKRAPHNHRYLQVTQPALRICDGADDLLDRGRLPAAFPVDPTENQEFGVHSLPRCLHFWPLRGPRVVAE